MFDKEEDIDPEELLRIVLDSIPLRVFWKDLDLNYRGANQKLLDDIGFTNLNDLVGQSDYAIYDNEADAEPKRNDDLEVIHSGESKLSIEEPLPINGKDTRWLNTNKVPMKNSEGRVVGVLGTYEDITEKVNYRNYIEKQANIDPLTGLANRRKLQSSINSTKFDNSVLLFIDLDQFKHVNDTLGHAVGDQILQEVAKRLTNVSQEADAFLARLGGDEFSIFKIVSSTEDMHFVAEKLAENVLSTLSKSFKIDSHIISTIGASIGIAFVEDKLKHISNGFIEADIAMYSAKANGRNNYRFFNETLREATQKKHILLNQLHKAIEKNEFKLVFQPQFDRAGNLVGAESLLRWRNEDLGNVSAAEFIDIAEESGLIHPIGDWVINEAIDTLSRWGDYLEINPDFRLAVNVSSKQFQNKYLVSSICEKMAFKGVNPNNMAIEVTESVLFECDESNTNSIARLKQEGFTIDIDDFGTGYSSLSKLSSMPIDTIKIDQSFIRNIDSNSTNEKIVQTIIRMAEELDLRIIAEGIETTEELVAIDDLGCNCYQGYLFGRPISFDQFSELYLDGAVESMADVAGRRMASGL